MHCYLIQSILAIDRLVDENWDNTGFEWFPLVYKQSKLIAIPAVLVVTRNHVDGTAVSGGGRDKFRAIFCEKFADCSMSCLFAERT